MLAEFDKTPYILQSGRVIAGRRVIVRAGDTIRVISRGKLDMNDDALPPLDADGLKETPAKAGLGGYPSSTCRRFSLICLTGVIGVGPEREDLERIFQGGKDETFVVKRSGELLLTVNHYVPEAISAGYWIVFVQRVEGVGGKPSDPKWVKIPEDYWDPYFWAETGPAIQGTPAMQERPAMQGTPAVQGTAAIRNYHHSCCCCCCCCSHP